MYTLPFDAPIKMQTSASHSAGHENTQLKQIINTQTIEMQVDTSDQNS